MGRPLGHAPGPGEASHATAPLLYAVLRCGNFRCAIDAARIDGFESMDSDDGVVDSGALLPLGVRLGLRQVLDAGRRPEQVRITGKARALLVDEVEGIVDQAQAAVLELPALTRLLRPIFRVVLHLSSGAIVPVLDLEEIEKIDIEARD